jgi:valyl-tRNA synthetase
MDAVTDGRVHIVPERYAKSYLDWLGEKRDWPVGRQLWWGHRIPVWGAALRRDEVQGLPESDIISAWRQKLVAAVDEFAAACGISGDLAVEFDRSAPEAAYVCARTVQAEEAIDGHCRRMHWTQIKDPRRLPVLKSADPRFQAEYRLANAAQFEGQSPEVLDTWFSSALWPHSTLGWPDDTPELRAFYPTSTLVTTRDIISLWVARMVLTGLFNVGDVPFHEVYITPKILDGYGETMSKSKGNGVDPLDVIEKFGADALRYGIAYLTTDTQDVKMPVEFECPHCRHLMAQTKKNRTLPRVECEKCGQPFGTQWAEKDQDKALPRAGVSNERFELGRRFCNKLWNAARFSLMNLAGAGVAGDESASPLHAAARAGGGEDADPSHPIADADLMLEDRWLLSRLATVTREVTEQLEQYRFGEASRTLYEFAWNDFCDYYVEITKARFKEPRQRATAQRVLAHVLDSLLRLLHPIVPFLTEEVWQLLNEIAPNRGLPTAARKEESICIAAWPTTDEAAIDPTIEEQFADFQAVLGAVREIRMAQNIPPRSPIEFRVRCDVATAKLLEPMRPYFAQIAEATCTALGPSTAPPERTVSKSLGDIDVHVDVSAFFDVDAERARLTKEIAQRRGHAESLEKKLSNENFVSRAPAEVVQQQRDALAEVRRQIESASAALAKLA